MTSPRLLRDPEIVVPHPPHRPPQYRWRHHDFDTAPSSSPRGRGTPARFSRISTAGPGSHAGEASTGVPTIPVRLSRTSTKQPCHAGTPWLEWEPSYGGTARVGGATLPQMGGFYSLSLYSPIPVSTVSDTLFFRCYRRVDPTLVAPVKASAPRRSYCTKRKHQTHPSTEPFTRTGAPTVRLPRGLQSAVAGNPRNAGAAPHADPWLSTSRGASYWEEQP